MTERGFAVEQIDATPDTRWLERVLALQPAAVVLDCAPAREEGWQIVRELRDHPNGRDIPILFYSLLDDRERGAVLAFDHLVKPVAAGVKPFPGNRS